MRGAAGFGVAAIGVAAVGMAAVGSTTVHDHNVATPELLSTRLCVYGKPEFHGAIAIPCQALTWLEHECILSR